MNTKKTNSPIEKRNSYQFHKKEGKIYCISLVIISFKYMEVYSGCIASPGCVSIYSVIAKHAKSSWACCAARQSAVWNRPNWDCQPAEVKNSKYQQWTSVSAIWVVYNRSFHATQISFYNNPDGGQEEKKNIKPQINVILLLCNWFQIINPVPLWTGKETWLTVCS